MRKLLKTIWGRPFVQGIVGVLGIFSGAILILPPMLRVALWWFEVWKP